jgi:hypothetical protein
MLRFCLTSTFTVSCAMIPHEITSRYYSRQGLLKFLRSKFGDLNFKVTEVGDAHFTFEAPEKLEEVCILSFQPQVPLLTPVVRLEVRVRLNRVWDRSTLTLYVVVKRRTNALFLSLVRDSSAWSAKRGCIYLEITESQIWTYISHINQGLFSSIEEYTTST